MRIDTHYKEYGKKDDRPAPCKTRLPLGLPMLFVNNAGRFSSHNAVKKASQTTIRVLTAFVLAMGPALGDQ